MKVRINPIGESETYTPQLRALVALGVLFACLTVAVTFLSAPLIAPTWAPVENPASLTPAPEQLPATADATAVIDINTATAAQLMALPGVGEVIAGNIIRYREAHGPFKSIDELINVERIGEKTLDNLRPYVKVG